MLLKSFHSFPLTFRECPKSLPFPRKLFPAGPHLLPQALPLSWSLHSPGPGLLLCHMLTLELLQEFHNTVLFAWNSLYTPLFISQVLTSSLRSSDPVFLLCKCSCSTPTAPVRYSTLPVVLAQCPACPPRLEQHEGRGCLRHCYMALLCSYSVNIFSVTQ